jgi:DNA/RNA endonuclease YhcR with UshA esterase domain
VNKSRGEKIMNAASKLFLSGLAILIFSAAPAIAQSAAPAAQSAGAPYDITKEVKVQGTVQKLQTSDGTGPIGTHILIQTTSGGVVDAHLGFSSAVTPAKLGVSEGQTVTVIGMMQDVGGNNVLLARVLTTSSRVFVLRSDHGIPVRAIPSGSFHTGGPLKGAL